MPQYKTQGAMHKEEQHSTYITMHRAKQYHTRSRSESAKLAAGTLYGANNVLPQYRTAWRQAM